MLESLISYFESNKEWISDYFRYASRNVPNFMSLTEDLSMNTDHGDIGGVKKPIHWGKSITDT